MDDNFATSLKRSIQAINCLLICQFILNLGILVENLIYGENSDNFPTRYSTVFVKLGITSTLLLGKYKNWISEVCLAFIFANFIGFYLSIAAFKLSTPPFFYLSSEAYRLTFQALERILLSHDIKFGIFVHVYRVTYWYSFCMYMGVFMGINENLIVSLIIVFVLLNEVMHTYYIYADSAMQLEYIRKITELKQQVQNIFKSIPEAIFVVKRDLSIIMKNTAANAVLQETSDGFLKETNLIEENEVPELLTNKVDELIHRKTQSDLKLGISKHGDRTFEWKASLVSWDGEDAVTLLMRDVTAIIQLEQAKHEAHMKNVMLRSVSHELRTPANAFTNLIERALSSKDLSTAVRGYLDLAHDNCQHLLHVVNDLLDYSQFLHGSFRLAKRKFDLRQVLKSSFKPYEYMIKASGITAELEIDNSLPSHSYNDPIRLSQVIMNLLSNATKFTKSGLIKVSAKMFSTNYMKVCVSDTGVGISLEQQANLCRLFGKLRENECLNPQGCGLGLHISNLLSLQLGGDELKISSSKGAGSSFSFLVSLKEVDLVATDYTIELEEDKLPFFLPLFDFGSQSSFGQVLVVDDNVFNRDIISSILSDMGITCHTASSGMDAIRAVETSQQPFNLIFLDYEMPELNGPQTAILLRQLHDRGEVKELPAIVAYTAYSSEKDILECKEAGMSDFLNKPCTVNEIRQIILKYCVNYKP
mmetsp:Transcript_16904/g.30260  ORF Transcript_16904/g.30260 Transcript_16904/m.30260 type:complete len:702 (+) Transcript_16904:507-2612(+)|eukprot:CAMPEP_0204908914 /NCGR_PEP_ID=MMETSP1397-20131031/7762_1 /ASSEMBLY_ACC=CAM_ASM_000891 /TAXON_ID=49980 /ORGANISM="Climacostomum Climacostomum virens, Strain Stock W-24" /LENGTH=701 /DNA_ID=CAMNT_0052078603 /DNA_START=25 /DNA_END=2130 /DNA_ORIENTATION=+